MDKDQEYTKFRERLSYICTTYRDRDAITYMLDSGGKQIYSFADVERIVQSWEEAFSGFGLLRGDRAAIISPASPRVILAALALARAGITTVMIDAALPEEEINRLLAFSDVRAIFTVDGLFCQLSDSERQGIPVFDLDSCEEGLSLFSQSAGTVHRGSTTDRAEDVISVIYSSGTTSTMKGIMVTYQSVVMSQKRFVDLTAIRAKMRYLLTLPLNHISGYSSTMIFLLTGCSIGMIEDINSSKLQKGLLTYNPHCFGMVPKVYDIICDKIKSAVHERGRVVEKGFYTILKLSRFLRKRFGIKIGKCFCRPVLKQAFGKNIWGLSVLGAACSRKTAEFFLDMGLEWANLYASTETNAPTACTGVYDRYPDTSVGNINRLHDIRFRIHDPDQEGVGEIYVKTVLIMKGYFRDPESTRNSFDEDGYFKTGDLGYVDERGYLYITGRRKESIILHNGKKISASDIDNFYQPECPGIFIAGCGIPDRDGFDELHLFVEKGSFSDDVIQTAVAALKNRSARTNSLYKLTGIHIIDKIPVTSVGKVKRFLLKEYVRDHAEESAEGQDMVSAGSDEREDETTEAAVIRIVRSFMPDKGQKVRDSSKLADDLQYDSLSVFEMCTALDERFGISIESRMYNGITVGEIIGMIEDRDFGAQEDPAPVDEYPLARSKKHKRDFRIFTKVSRKIWKIRYYGMDHLDPDTKYIFCPNHESHFDGLWVMGGLDDERRDSMCSIAAAYLLRRRIYRLGLMMMGGIPVHRHTNTAPAMKRALECLESGRYNLLIHPEGTRTRDGSLGTFKPGAARLSLDSGVAIIPVAICGSYEIFPPDRKIPHFFYGKRFRKYPLEIRFGNPISPGGRTEEEITMEIRDQILKMKECQGGEL